MPYRNWLIHVFTFLLIVSHFYFKASMFFSAPNAGSKSYFVVLLLGAYYERVMVGTLFRLVAINHLHILLLRHAFEQ